MCSNAADCQCSLYCRILLILQVEDWQVSRPHFPGVKGACRPQAHATQPMRA